MPRILTFGHLKDVRSKAETFRLALEDMEAASERYETILKEQESEAITALLKNRQEIKKEMEYFHENLLSLEQLLSDYIADMTALVMPVKLIIIRKSRLNTM